MNLFIFNALVLSEIVIEFQLYLMHSCLLVNQEFKDQILNVHQVNTLNWVAILVYSYFILILSQPLIRNHQLILVIDLFVLIVLFFLDYWNTKSSMLSKILVNTSADLRNNNAWFWKHNWIGSIITLVYLSNRNH